LRIIITRETREEVVRCDRITFALHVEGIFSVSQRNEKKRK